MPLLWDREKDDWPCKPRCCPAVRAPSGARGSEWVGRAPAMPHACLAARSSASIGPHACPVWDCQCVPAGTTPQTNQPGAGVLRRFLPCVQSRGKQRPTALLRPHSRPRPRKDGSTGWKVRGPRLRSHLPVLRPPLSLGLRLLFHKTKGRERDTFTLSTVSLGISLWDSTSSIWEKHVGLPLGVRNEAWRNRLMWQTGVPALASYGVWCGMLVMEPSVEDRAQELARATKLYILRAEVSGPGGMCTGL